MAQAVCVIVDTGDRARLAAIVADRNRQQKHVQRARGNDPQAVAHFVNRLAFCLLADDVGLLPAGLFEQMLDASRKRPAQFEGYARQLFAAWPSVVAR